MATKDREEKSWVEKFAENETCRKWVVIAGVAGIALIFLSGLFSPGKEETQEASSQPAAQSAQAYTQELEQSLAELVTNIQGAGNAKVMVTVERSAEQVYAQEEKRSTQTTEDRGSNNSTETNYILVKDAGCQGGGSGVRRRGRSGGATARDRCCDHGAGYHIGPGLRGQSRGYRVGPAGSLLCPALQYRAKINNRRSTYVWVLENVSLFLRPWSSRWGQPSI